MTPKSHPSESGADLRRRAEQKALEEEAQSPNAFLSLTPEDRQRTLHELRVHQIELEMQNEELRSAQVKLDTSRARYFDLYDLAPVGYCSLSPKGLILEANLTAATMLRVSRGSLVNQPIFRYIMKEDQDIYYRHRKSLSDTGVPQVCELRMLRTHGQPIWVRLDTTTAIDEHGDSVCRLVFTDISERKRAEEEHELLREQFNQAQKMESVGRLAGGVAHDFNNMLTVICGNAELALGSSPPDHPLHDVILEILKAAQRSAEVAQQLLAFARKQIISPKILGLNETLEGMLKMLRRLIGEDIDLVWIPHVRLWPVVMDPAQIDQILVNLCINARDAITDGGKITIETDNKSFDSTYCTKNKGYAPGDYVVLCVRDNGCGMDRPTLDHLFEPFFTTKDESEGSGLGLAMVYGIVKQNNGFIIVESEPARGTSIKIHLPRCVTAATGVRTSKEPMSLHARGRETILVVEDEPAILVMSRLMLKRLGYTVLTATTPGEAIRLTEAYSDKIHLVLTDVIMPEMNGKALAKRLLSLDPELKVLFMSGYSSTIIASEGLLDPNMHFLEKPFSRNVLAAKVRQALGKKEKVQEGKKVQKEVEREVEK